MESVKKSAAVVESFHDDYPVYGLSLIGCQKPLTVAAFMQGENFARLPGSVVVLESTEQEDDGKFTIKLLSKKGLAPLATLGLTFQSDTATQQNYIVGLFFLDFSKTPRRKVQTFYNGKATRLDEIILKLGKLLSRFYDFDALAVKKNRESEV